MSIDIEHERSHSTDWDTHKKSIEKVLRLQKDCFNKTKQFKMGEYI